VRIARFHWIVVDAYALQHPDAYCRSAKSLAAHLTGLCAGLEHPDNPLLRRALQRWLNGASPVAKPELPAFRGSRTIADLSAVDVAHYAAVVDAWTTDVWAAYAPLQGLARGWIERVIAAS
jgi:hypothetical protein